MKRATSRTGEGAVVTGVSAGGPGGHRSDLRRRDWAAGTFVSCSGPMLAPCDTASSG